MSAIPLLPTSLVGLALALLWILERLQCVRLPLPPGPRSWPIVGSALEMPAFPAWEKYREWCEAYNSDIVFIDLPGRPTLILGSVKAATDLLDKRSHLYSDRIPTIMLEMMTRNFALGFMPYSSRWRAHRRMFHEQFRQPTVHKYRPVQLRQTRAFLSWVLKSPEHTHTHVHHLVMSVVLYITYGKRITGMDDEYITSSQTAVQSASMAVMPGAHWYEWMPFLEHLPSWVPGTGAKRAAEKHLRSLTRMIEEPFLDVKTALKKGTAPPSLAATLIERNREKQEIGDGLDSDEVAQNVAAAVYAAGTDTTASACECFLLAMAMYPKVQAKAQAELNRVVGSYRLPEYEDLESMPYLRAVVMETIRWLPALPAGVPHGSIVDDVYNGYHIPKGTMVLPNIWAMLHDPEDYPDPEKFEPERYLDVNGNLNHTTRDPATIAFGFGRRICPGRHFNDNSLSIFIASVLHVFNISAGVDAMGKPVVLNPEVVGHMIVWPREVPCGLTPRSEAAARLVVESTPDLTVA